MRRVMGDTGEIWTEQDGQMRRALDSNYQFGQERAFDCSRFSDAFQHECIAFVLGCE